MDACYSRPQETAFGRAMQDFGILPASWSMMLTFVLCHIYSEFFPQFKPCFRASHHCGSKAYHSNFNNVPPLCSPQRAAFLDRYLDNINCPIPKLTNPSVAFTHLEIVYHAIESLSLNFAKTCMDRIEFIECQMCKGIAHLTGEQGFKISPYLDSWHCTGEEINQERDESRSEVEESEGERIQRMALNAERRRRRLARTPHPWKWPPTPAELHRIKRAFWLLEILFLLFAEEQSVDTGTDVRLQRDQKCS